MALCSSFELCLLPPLISAVLLKRTEIFYTNELSRYPQFLTFLTRALDLCKERIEESKPDEPVRLRKHHDLDSDSESESDEEELDVKSWEESEEHTPVDPAAAKVARDVKEMQIRNEVNALTTGSTTVIKDNIGLYTCLSPTVKGELRAAGKRVRAELEPSTKQTKFVVETFLPVLNDMIIHLDQRVYKFVLVNALKYAKK